MADLDGNLQASSTTKVVGSDATGSEQTPVQSTTAGALHTNLRNAAGTEIGTSSVPVRVDPTGTTTQPVSATALPLPSGAATSALQTTLNTTLSAIDTKTPTLGQKTSVASSPVVISSDQSAIPVSGTVAVSNFPATQNVAVTSIVEVEIKNDTGNPLPISAASLPLPTGAATSALQTSGNASLSSIDSKLTSPLTVTGPLTDTQLRASVVPVSLASTTITSSSLPTGAATSALQGTGNTSLANIDTKTPALGQALAASSVPVVLTAAQLATLTPLTTVAVTGPLTDAQLRAAAVAISAASLPLPTGAATSALQTALNTTLSSIDTKTPTIGQKTMVASSPVVVASDQLLSANIKDTLGVPLGTKANPFYTNGTAEFLSPLPSLKVSERRVLAPSAAYYSESTILSKTAIKEFHVGGRIACEGTLAKYKPSEFSLIPGGGFNSTGDVALWTNTSLGSSLTAGWAYSTAQFVSSPGSVRLNFTQSDVNSYPEITYTYSTPQDLSLWRYISAQVRVTVATGGSQSRTVQIRVRSGTAIRIWSITGTTVSAPFATEQWLQIQGELENPSTITGTGVFDINNVDSISLRLTDGGNKAGTIYWDDVKLTGKIEIQDKIYTDGPTRQLEFDPVIIFLIGEVLLLIIRNNGATSSEFQIASAGVDVT